MEVASVLSGWVSNTANPNSKTCRSYFGVLNRTY
jgi:hypothetical protein